MAQIWDADIDIPAELAKALIEAQFPELQPVRLEAFGAGWDNVAYRVNERYVFRFPRRKFAVRFLENETRLLPRLASLLPIPIPNPRFVGAPEESYPYPFAGYSLIPGITACRAPLSDEDRAQNAVPLARFLAALHGIEIDAATRETSPGDEIGRTDIPRRAVQAIERLEKIAPLLPGVDLSGLPPLLDRLSKTPPYSRPACWVHGDLYPRHLLIDAKRRLCGVIDWGDMHLGDPALDLSIAFSFLPPDARPAFRETYGPIDEATWDRARFRALHYGTLLILFGADIGDEAIRQAGEYALCSAPL